MRKGVAIPYIIAILLGIIVIGVLGYWFINLSGKGSGVGTAAECTTKKAEYCATQIESNWDGITKVCGSDFSDCFNYCSRIIPGWKPVDSNNHPECKQTQQPTQTAKP